DMASIYVHLSGRDVDNAILDVYGLKHKEKQEIEKFQPMICDRCNCSNSPGSRICSNCGHSFAAGTPKQTNGQNLLAEIMKDPEIKKIILEKLMEKEFNSLAVGVTYDK
ncbi:hypothetical protein HZC07_05830, partial [Candidatus Micrarchaeota archaeon]|nr:hypothetical protein [Candidatus Micrarchaeota archaeon]